MQNYLKYEYISITEVIQTDTNVFPAVCFCSNVNDKKLVSEFRFMNEVFKLPVKENEEFDSFEIKGITNHNCLRFNGFSRNQSLNLRKSSKSEIFENKVTGIITTFKLRGNNLFLYIDNNYLNVYKSSLDYQKYRKLRLKKGYSYEIMVTKSVVKKLGYPYNDCEVDTHETYRQINCIEACIYEKNAFNYNCSLSVGFYAKSELEDCRKMKTSDGIYKDQKEIIQAKCLNYCPKECETTSYSIDMLELKDQSNSQLKLRIFYSDFNYKLTSEYPKMTIFNLIGTIGGILGVFIGFQLLTLVELFENS